MKRQVHIEKLPSGNYSVRHWQNNKFVREWFSDYGLAKHRAADLTLKLTALQQGQPDPTLRPIDIYNKYIESIRHTHRHTTLRIKEDHAKPFFLSSQHLTQKRIKEYKNEILNQVSISTVSIRLREIRTVCSWAKKEGYIPENLFEGIEIPSSKEAGQKLNVATIKAIWEASDPEFKPFLAFLIYTGARYGEISKTRWIDLDLGKGIWHIPAEHCKTNKERYVPLSTSLITILNSSVKKEGLLFEGWTKNTARWYLQKACKKLGIAKPRPHDFRHNFASHWQGDTRKLQDMLGWTTGAMLKRYSHFTVEDIRKEAEEKGIKVEI